ncbi:MAG: dihydrolipoamide dehydrogenase [Flavobacteriaceae bacterium]|nr:dihydrolipoamide dehydrogenase [Flavobacteriaceae bacterium]|tara:strand:+ start:170 stop:613 length:444 start_codon:yes stop_codon:yes gene_type:complete
MFSSCEGPEGPPGEPGINILGQVFEVTINLNGANGFQQVVNIPTNIEVFESDAILVYRWEGTFDGADIWTPLPATYFDNGGTFLYTFNHTFFDVQFFLDGNFDLTTLGSEWKNDQSFRIAVVPAEFADANLTMEQLENATQVEFLGN